jgi:hypothetical protein
VKDPAAVVKVQQQVTVPEVDLTRRQFPVRIGDVVRRDDGDARIRDYME